MQSTSSKTHSSTSSHKRKSLETKLEMVLKILSTPIQFNSMDKDIEKTFFESPAHAPHLRARDRHMFDKLCSARGRAHVHAWFANEFGDVARDERESLRLESIEMSGRCSESRTRWRASGARIGL
eukprot:441348_1